MLVAILCDRLTLAFCLTLANILSLLLTDKASPVVPRFEPTFNNDNICVNPTIDAIFLTADRSTYVFKGDSYWKLTRDSVADGYPRKISQDWRGLPSNIDAAFTWESTKATYFIKGSKYWKFVNRNPYPGYPKNIKDGFPGIPNNVDTAFVCHMYSSS